MISRAQPNFRRTAERDITPPHNRHYVLFACMSFDIFAGPRRSGGGLPAVRRSKRSRPSRACCVVAKATGLAPTGAQSSRRVKGAAGPSWLRPRAASGRRRLLLREEPAVWPEWCFSSVAAVGVSSNPASAGSSGDSGEVNWRRHRGVGRCRRRASARAAHFRSRSAEGTLAPWTKRLVHVPRVDALVIARAAHTRVRGYREVVNVSRTCSIKRGPAGFWWHPLGAQGTPSASCVPVQAARRCPASSCTRCSMPSSPPVEPQQQ